MLFESRADSAPMLCPTVLVLLSLLECDLGLSFSDLENDITSSADRSAVCAMFSSRRKPQQRSRQDLIEECIFRHHRSLTAGTHDQVEGRLTNVDTHL